MSEEDSQHKHRVRDWWDKLDIISKFVTAGLVTLITIFGTSYLNKQQDTNRNSQLFSQFISEREKAENQVRKDMFEKVLAEFWHKPAADACALDIIDRQLLQLELISRNFHETLDLSPLFSHVLLSIVREIRPGKFEYRKKYSDKEACSKKAFRRLKFTNKKNNQELTETEKKAAIKAHIKKLRNRKRNQLIKIAQRITSKQMESLSDVVKRVRMKVELDETCQDTKPNENVDDKTRCKKEIRKVTYKDSVGKEVTDCKKFEQSSLTRSVDDGNYAAFDNLNALCIINRPSYKVHEDCSSQNITPDGNQSVVLNLGETCRKFNLRVRRSFPRWSRVYLEIETDRKLSEINADPGEKTNDASFWVSYFDFPLTDNTYLSNKERFAVVLEDIDDETNIAELSLLYFPASYAGFKEKAFYQQRLLHSLMKGK